MADVMTLIAVLGCTLFTGAAVYITLVEHPARLACGTDIAAREFVPSYKRAAVMQATLALLAASAGALRWMQGGGSLWLWASLLILAVVPFTLLVIMPTNRRLLDPRRDPGSAETRRLLEVWGHLHAVRSGLSLIASCLFIVAASRS
jgi:hypothetical protein